jgi:hypothetical protein
MMMRPGRKNASLLLLETLRWYGSSERRRSWAAQLESIVVAGGVEHRVDD